MSILPGRSMAYLSAFAPLFYQRSWEQASALVVGAILAPGARTVTSVRAASFVDPGDFCDLPG